MTSYLKQALIITLIALLILNPILIPSISAASVTVEPDKQTYKIGESISISGTATPNGLMTIQLFDSDNQRRAIGQVQVSLEGKYSYLNLYRFTGADSSGEWKVKVYDVTTKTTAETTVTLLPKSPPSLTITITPEKPEYKAETIIIVLTSDKELTSASLTISQKDSVPIPITASQLGGTLTTWGGSTTIRGGYDGKAVIEASGIDFSGLTGTSNYTFTVDTVPPHVTINAPTRTDSATITVSGTVDDPIIKQIQITVPPAQPISTPVTNEKWSQDITLPATGSNTITATATDIAGNEGSASAVIIYVGVLEVFAEELKKIGDDISKLKTEDLQNLKEEQTNQLEKLREDEAKARQALIEKINILTNLVLVAVILSVIAAAVSIYTVITITRKLVLK